MELRGSHKCTHGTKEKSQMHPPDKVLELRSHNSILLTKLWNKGKVTNVVSSHRKRKQQIHFPYILPLNKEVTNAFSHTNAFSQHDLEQRSHNVFILFMWIKGEITNTFSILPWNKGEVTNSAFSLYCFQTNKKSQTACFGTKNKSLIMHSPSVLTWF